MTQNIQLVQFQGREFLHISPSEYTERGDVLGGGLFTTDFADILAMREEGNTDIDNLLVVTSYAAVTSDGTVVRHGVAIGTAADLEVVASAVNEIVDPVVIDTETTGVSERRPSGHPVVPVTFQGVTLYRVETPDEVKVMFGHDALLFTEENIVNGTVRRGATARDSFATLDIDGVVRRSVTGEEIGAAADITTSEPLRACA